MPKVQNMCNFDVRIILEVKNVGNCVDDVDLVFHITTYCLLKTVSESESERERERDRQRKERHCTCFLCYIEIYTPTLPRYKIEIKS